MDSVRAVMAVMLVLQGASAQAGVAPPLAGTYSNVCMHPESGDLPGTELTFAGPADPGALLVLASGLRVRRFIMRKPPSPGVDAPPADGERWWWRLCCLSGSSSLELMVVQISSSPTRQPPSPY
mgnify:CR=1 FL=1